MMENRPGYLDVSSRRITYTSDQLKKVGEQCAGRLPPASAVQAMFAYEMQRATELEQLFHNQLFRLARAEQQVDEKERRIQQLEARVTKVEADSQKHALDSMLATSQTRIQAQIEKLKSCTADIDQLTTRLARLEGVVLNLKSDNTECAGSIHQAPAPASAIEDVTMKKQFDRLDSDIEQIFTDHNELFEARDFTNVLLTDIRNRLQTVEESVIIYKATGKPGSPAVKKPAPVTLSGSYWAMPENIAHEPLDDSVQLNNLSSEGGSQMSLREIKVDHVRPFSPGKQWAP